VKHPIIAGTLAAALIIGAAFFMGSAALAATCGAVSFYAEAHHGKRMANGKPFNMHAMTTAAPSIPLGTKLRVTANGKSVVVTVTDRGPARRLNRVLDLSKAAFAKLSPTSKGVIRACFERVSP
jgi:rare lipoprotein A